MDQANWEIDFLTKCFTRNSLSPLLEQQLLEASLIKKPCSIALIDLDHFKTMNDTYGHLFGDEALKYFSSSLRLSLEEDYLETMVQRFIFRYGGDEFVIVFPGKNSQEAQRTVLNILRNMKRRHFLFKGKQFKMSFSGGIATYPHDGKNVNELIESADRALYFSKKHGKGKITQFGKIKAQSFKWMIDFVLAAIVVGLVALIIIAKFSVFHQFYASLLAPKPNLPKIESIYLKSGAVLKGVIVGKGDPVEVKLSFKEGQGTVLLKRSEIVKIVPEETQPENFLGKIQKVNVPKIDTIYLKSGGVLRGVIIKEGDPLELRMILDRGEGMILLRQSEISKIERGE